MGFEAPRKVYRLEFEQPEYAGLIVRVRPLPLGEFIDITSIDGEITGNNPEARAANRAMFDQFAGCLVDWNVEEDGVPVPATLAGLRSLDTDFGTLLVREWMTIQAGVPAPLDEGSGAGNSSPEASLPMVPLSASQAS